VTDPTLFERILRNLTDNAIKYTARGRVEIACERRDNALVISVRDTGPGIHAEEREAVFQEFYQSSEARRDRDSGLGLGLAIVKRLSDLLGFSIRVESEVGVGTTFMLTVPERMVSGDSVDAIGDLEEEAPISLDRFAIVYIDDDARVLSAMKLLLGEWGCDVIAGASLEEVRAKIRERGMHPEAILSDYRLAGPTNGVEAIDALREEFGGLPAAVLTGESSPEARDRLRETEYPVLLKPVNPKELRKLLEMFRSIG